MGHNDHDSQPPASGIPLPRLTPYEETQTPFGRSPEELLQTLPGSVPPVPPRKDRKPVNGEATWNPKWQCAEGCRTFFRTQRDFDVHMAAIHGDEDEPLTDAEEAEADKQDEKAAALTALGVEQKHQTFEGKVYRKIEETQTELYDLIVKAEAAVKSSDTKFYEDRLRFTMRKLEALALIVTSTPPVYITPTTLTPRR